MRKFRFAAVTAAIVALLGLGSPVAAMAATSAPAHAVTAVDHWPGGNGHGRGGRDHYRRDHYRWHCHWRRHHHHWYRVCYRRWER